MSTLLRNRRAYHDYEITEKIEAGIKLTGQEVKAIKEGKGDLTGSHIKVDGEKLSLIGLNVPPYSKAGILQDYDPGRTRTLLCHKKEIAALRGKMDRQGFTLIPLKIYTKGTLLKLSFGIAKGKKRSDKRADIIKKQQQLESDRLTKQLQ